MAKAGIWQPSTISAAGHDFVRGVPEEHHGTSPPTTASSSGSQDNGFDGQYVGYRITSINDGNAKIEGLESATITVVFLPGWTKSFGIYASLTCSDRGTIQFHDRSRHPGRNDRGFLNTTGNVGLGTAASVSISGCRRSIAEICAPAARSRGCNGRSDGRGTGSHGIISRALRRVPRRRTSSSAARPVTPRIPARDQLSHVSQNRQRTGRF